MLPEGKAGDNTLFMYRAPIFHKVVHSPMPQMREWIEAAKREPEDIDELRMEF